MAVAYPDRLAGDAIPLAARIVCVADVHDELRSRRSHKSALSHSANVQVMTDQCPGQFDPLLMQAISRLAPEFEWIFRDTLSLNNQDTLPWDCSARDGFEESEQVPATRKTAWR